MTHPSQLAYDERKRHCILYRQTCSNISVSKLNVIHSLFCFQISSLWLHVVIYLHFQCHDLSYSMWWFVVFIAMMICHVWSFSRGKTKLSADALGLQTLDPGASLSTMYKCLFCLSALSCIFKSAYDFILQLNLFIHSRGCWQNTKKPRTTLRRSCMLRKHHAQTTTSAVL